MTAVDLDALEAEALARVPDRHGVEFTYRDVVFRAPPGRCWPLDVQRRLAEGDLEALDVVLGQGTFAALCAAGMTQAGFEALLGRLRPDGAGGPPLPKSSA